MPNGWLTGQGVRVMGWDAVLGGLSSVWTMFQTIDAVTMLFTLAVFAVLAGFTVGLYHFVRRVFMNGG